MTAVILLVVNTLLSYRITEFLLLTFLIFGTTLNHTFANNPHQIDTIYFIPNHTFAYIHYEN